MELNSSKSNHSMGLDDSFKAKKRIVVPGIRPNQCIVTLFDQLLIARPNSRSCFAENGTGAEILGKRKETQSL